MAGKTRNGKTLVIKPTVRHLYEIIQQGGGKLPKSLWGSFTSIEAAQISVDRYLSNASYITREQVEERKNA